ncbi:seipin-3-like isoform X2 [Asparagus officinalis]|uniref:seipin-3-like isoform X2 n=1 Tax=Asparagus officinalis TaxID=4686 RepID=UPI00098E8659|nr:seipin-3-like isoform X2 [Asparagus officinalis]
MEETSNNSTLTLDSSVVVEDNESRAPDHRFSYQTLVLFAADLVIRVLFFQISLLICPFTYIIWLFRCSSFLILNPFGTLRHVRDGVMEKLLWISNSLMERISSKLYEKLKRQHKLVKRMSRGIFWSFYVFLVLLSLLVMAFVAGSLIMHGVVEVPVMIEKDFSFDYTKSSPDALVKLGKWDTVPFGLDAGGKLYVSPNHMLKLKVSLTLPESDYNWKLGIFQVS